MAINLATKFSKKLALPFTKASIIAGHFSTEYDFTGTRTVEVYRPVTVALQDYDRTLTTGSRFGQMVEMEDTKQSLEMTQEKSFTISIDRGNNSDQQMIKRAGLMLPREIAEQVVPTIDKYALGKWAAGAGTEISCAALSAKNIVQTLLDTEAAMDEASVPDSHRVIYLSIKNYNFLRLSPEFIGIQKLGYPALSRNHVGDFSTFHIVKTPASYLPEGVEYLATYKNAVLQPTKLQTARILTEDKDVDGHILQGRWYYDAFVLETLNKGVVVGKTA